ncbi:ABC transporter permease [Amycolatopsis orientalis]|uniref:ABC transporter permease n=1 Tax=Amycolatopsis orientalis TaxID=31958 RepID=UPI000420AE13|nr:ABC transporter permease [Amycolatopsis orientalis]
MFRGLLERDLLITRKQLPGVMAQVLMQPLLMLLVFGKVLGALGYTPPGYPRLLLPGLIALNAFFAATQNASFPLAMEFTTRTIENRLRAPVTLPWIVAERIVAASARGIITAVLMAPLGALLLGGLDWPLSGLPPALFFTVAGALTGGAVGVTIGSLVSPARIGITFSLVMPPLLFTGSAQFPFPELTAVPWFRALCSLNPMTYVSEGLRGALTPEISHLPGWTCVGGLVAAALIFLPASLWSFKRRAIV